MWLFLWRAEAMGNPRNQRDNEQQHRGLDGVFQSPHLCQVRQTAGLGASRFRQRASGNRPNFAGRLSWADRGRSSTDRASILKNCPHCRAGCYLVADSVAWQIPWTHLFSRKFLLWQRKQQRNQRKSKNSIRARQDNVRGFLKSVAGLRCRPHPVWLFSFQGGIAWHRTQTRRKHTRQSRQEHSIWEWAKPPMSSESISARRARTP